MNKEAFIISGIVGIIGLVTLILTRIIQLVMPILGRIAFQAAMAGSYSPSDYQIDFRMLQSGSFILIILAAVLCYRFYWRN
ncbi:MAG: hypothetical protein ACQEQG_10725 [Bacillota bacterium]